jgi:hypothetical protein
VVRYLLLAKNCSQNQPPTTGFNFTILKIFSLIKLENKWRFWLKTQNIDYAKYWIMTLVFKKNVIFSPKIGRKSWSLRWFFQKNAIFCRKLAKNAKIITLTPWIDVTLACLQAFFQKKSPTLKIDLCTKRFISFNSARDPCYKILIWLNLKS